MRGELFTVTGRVPHKVVRPVVLQLRSGRSWRNVVRGTTSSRGRFRLVASTTASSGSYRVRAPAGRFSGTRLRALTLPSTQVRTVGQRVLADIPAALDHRAPGSVKAALVPIRKGRPVVLQKQVGGTWRSERTVRSSANGTASFDVPTGTLGSTRYRFVATAWHGATRVASAAAEVAVLRPAPVITAPASGATVSGKVDVVVSTPDAYQTGPVRLFLDGVPLGEADGSGPRTYEWDTTGETNGRHELVGKVVGADGRLSAGRQVVVDNPVDEGDAGLPDGFGLDVLASGFSLPTGFVPLGNDDALITEKAGLVRMVKDGALLPTSVLDLRDQVLTEGDLGLTGIAVDPHYATNGYLYLAYVYRAPDWQPSFPTVSTQRISRFTVVDGVADPDSEKVLVGAPATDQCNANDELDTPGCLRMLGAGHSVDDLVFDDDGNLLVSVGDSTIFWGVTDENSTAQDIDVLTGKVLRIDPATGFGVPGNPFFVASHAAANRSRVLAYGFRNPFRLTFDPADETLYAGDVGDGTWEEINAIEPGANYGWPCFEGDGERHLQGGTLDDECGSIWEDHALVSSPAHAYPHTANGGSITGGVFYDGDSYPTAYDGDYFFGDYAQAFVRTMGLAGGAQTSAPVDLMDSAATHSPVQFRMGPDGTVWYLGLGSGAPGDGELRRITYGECGSGEFLAEYFANETMSGEPFVVRCEDHVQHDWGTDGPVPGVPADHFSVRWTGRVPLDGGKYRFTAKADGGARVVVAGTRVVNAWTDQGSVVTTTGDRSLRTGVSNVVVEYHHGSGTASANVSWRRLGSAPRVTLKAPYNGIRVANGTDVPYVVTVADKEDGTLPPSSVQVTWEALHYPSAGAYHVHPEASRTGLRGSFDVEADHAPGVMAFRLTAYATDSSGWQGSSPAIYVCVEDNLVGPCS